MTSAAETCLRVPELLETVLRETDPSTLPATALVSRLWHALTVPLLYDTFRHHGSTENKRLVQFVQALEDPDCGRHVKNVSVVFGMPTSPNTTLVPLVARLLSLAPQIETLHFKLVPVGTSTDSLCSALSSLRNLKHLILMFDGPSLQHGAVEIACVSPWLSSLQAASQLITLRISQCTTTGADLKNLPIFPRLTSLSLHATSFSDDELLALVTSQKALRELNLSLMDHVSNLVNPFRMARHQASLPCCTSTGILTMLKEVLPRLDVFRFCASPFHMCDDDIKGVLRVVKTSTLRTMALETPCVCIHDVLSCLPATIRTLSFYPGLPNMISFPEPLEEFDAQIHAMTAHLSSAPASQLDCIYLSVRILRLGSWELLGRLKEVCAAKGICLKRSDQASAKNWGNRLM